MRGGSSRHFGPGFRPAEAVLAAYFALTAAVIVAGRSNLPLWPAYSAAHVLIVAVFLGLRRVHTVKNTAAALVRRFVPIAFVPLMYVEMASLNNLVFGGRYFDSTVTAWEAAVFGGQMAVLVREWAPNHWLSEYLHLGYFSYYFLVPALALSLAVRGKWEEFETLFSAGAVTAASCMLCFLFFPVAGPFHYFDPVDPHSMGSVFPPLVHSVLNRGSSVGTAFPSSHVAMAVTVWIAAFRYDRPVFLAYVFLVPALALGAVYGGFHYAIDALAGAVLGILSTAAGFALARPYVRKSREAG